MKVWVGREMWSDFLVSHFFGLWSFIGLDLCYWKVCCFCCHRFRKPNLELICVYAVQNPFLYGMYELRREQMKMQQESLQAKLRTGLKERHFFVPTTFENLEAICRNNFNSVPNLKLETGEHQAAVKLYSTSDAANQAFEGNAFSIPGLLSLRSELLFTLLIQGLLISNFNWWRDITLRLSISERFYWVHTAQRRIWLNSCLISFVITISVVKQ